MGLQTGFADSHGIVHDSNRGAFIRNRVLGVLQWTSARDYTRIRQLIVTTSILYCPLQD